MSQRRSGRSIVGLVLEIAVIGLVVTLLPKFGFQRQSASPAQAAGPAASSWWQAAPASRETSWRPANELDEIHVEQTLESASQQLLRGVADYATRAAADLAPPPAPAEPREWRKY